MGATRFGAAESGSLFQNTGTARRGRSRAGPPWGPRPPGGWYVVISTASARTVGGHILRCEHRPAVLLQELQDGRGGRGGDERHQHEHGEEAGRDDAEVEADVEHDELH